MMYGSHVTYDRVRGSVPWQARELLALPPYTSDPFDMRPTMERELMSRLRDGDLDPDVAAAVLPRLWFRLAPRPLTMMAPGKWRRLWAVSGYTVEGERAERPSQPVRLFRGAPPEFAAGWCWSDDPRVAMSFASVHGSRSPEGWLWTTLAPPEALCARHGHVFDEDGETLVDEWVVDPSKLDSVRPWTDAEVEAVPDATFLTGGRPHLRLAGGNQRRVLELFELAA